ncbi:AbrB/MazE/SpoVT family DNA-binding domain-containing protein [Actinokineospora sp. UTMC 2448]|uniref:AbrB/MazE/SpoVT family DNA-binding domain-containing protein n=1 Tax=Actinokineospora sp. UTMC 2448 TaxID=2268449 RepID=UPI00216428E2|nr:AbrB/MazE/SpoVT family DNA-binding domain-containing protein [Actinokineospora sp. UTMC 2448]UVS79416.1 hypothetical protein Actkin_03164 [Actinokineospora sp. UTMC 2448]
MSERLTALFSPPTPEPAPPLTTTNAQLWPDETDLLLTLGTIDHSGRVAASKLLQAMGWHAGQATNARLRGHAIVISPMTQSPNKIDCRQQVFIPAGLRDLTGIRKGDTVMLIGVRQQQLLIAYSAKAMAKLVSRIAQVTP